MAENQDAKHDYSPEVNFNHVGNSQGVATEDGGRSSSKCMTDEERNIKKGLFVFLLQ